MRYLAAMLVSLSLGMSAAHAEDTVRLKILVYGATGNIGSLVVDEALSRGHAVTAVSRDPTQIKQSHRNLSAVKGDLLDEDSIAGLVVDQDVVIISVRGIIGKSKSPESALQRIAVEKVVNVLRDLNCSSPRLIHVGGAGTLEVEPGVLYADKLPKVFLPKSLELEIRGQVLALEYLRTVDDVKWSYATPAKNFTNGARTGEFRLGGDQLMENAKGRSKISRADFAVALVDEAENANYVRQRFSVAY
ncbi:MAG: NAD(P)H-binding protein [Gammaproteobacteria bacterium]|nr:NAD(P)H-binding protein [Gammaproteobacteria bacterium]MDH3415074.1 NAD(P)H-binding protein [Gammaproteobacteria bacterium]